jgi:dethiobiotin synthetase
MQNVPSPLATRPSLTPYTHLRGWLVTGTDTDAGKTCISAGLLYVAGQFQRSCVATASPDGAPQFLRTAGYKPVAAGARVLAGAHEVAGFANTAFAPTACVSPLDGFDKSTDLGGPQADQHPLDLAASTTLHNDDVHALHCASTAPITLAQVGPCVLQAACAPHIAARLQGAVLRAAPLLAGAAQLAQQADWLVVEGAGGFALPLCLPGTDADFPQGFDGTDLAAYLGLPVVLVVGLRTGCLNHAVLTAQAIRAKGLRLAGWVANSLQADWPYHADNVDALHQLLGSGCYGITAPCWGVVPWLPSPSAAAVAQHLDVQAIHRAISQQL